MAGFMSGFRLVIIAVLVAVGILGNGNLKCRQRRPVGRSPIPVKDRHVLVALLIEMAPKQWSELPPPDSSDTTDENDDDLSKKQMEQRVVNAISPTSNSALFSPEESKIYARALHSGKANVTRGRIVVVGKDGVGKTCLIDSLLNKTFRNHTSTRGVKITSSSKNAVNWNENFEFDHLNKPYAEAIINVEKSTVDDDDDDDTDYSSVIAGLSSLLTYDLHVEYLQSCADSLQPVVNIRDGNEELIITFWDHGGQEAYLPAHSALLGDYSLFSTGIYLIVFNQAELLNDTASSFWRYENEAESQTLHFFEKNSDYLSSWMTHITIAHSELVEDGMGAEEGIAFPPTFFIGTHSEDPKAVDNRRKQIEIIDKLVESRSYQKHIVQPQENVIFWDIENSNSGKQGKDPGKELRTKIESLISKYWLRKRQQEQPVRWLQFEKVLQLSELKIASLDEVKGLAQLCRISNEEFPVVLKYLSSLGVILHYPEIKEIEMTVFADPQWLIDVICSFITSKQPSSIFKNEWNFALRTGNVSRSLAQHFLEEARVEKRHEIAVLTILEHLDIISNPHPSTSIGQSPFLYVPYLIQRKSKEKPSFWNRIHLEDNEIPPPLIFAPIDLDVFPEPLYFRLVVKCLKAFPSSPKLSRNYSIINTKDFTFELIYLQKRYVVASVSSVRPHMTRSDLHSGFSKLRLFLHAQLEQARQNGMKGFHVELCFQPGLKRAERVIDDELVSLEDCLEGKGVIYNRGRVERIWKCLSIENVDLWKESDEGPFQALLVSLLVIGASTVGLFLFSIIRKPGNRIPDDFQLQDRQENESLETEAADMPWNDFADAVVSACRHEWSSIALQLNFKYSLIEELKSDNSNLPKLRTILEKFKLDKGEKTQTRKEILKACNAVGIWGDLKNELKLKKKQK